MVPRWLLSITCLALIVRLAACADCAGPTSPAKFRHLYIADVKDGNPADVKALSAAYTTWIKSCATAGLVVREGHAPAISQDPSVFGFKTLPNNSYMGDFGGWSDWKSLEDLRACVAKGLKEGTVTTIRRYAVRAARIVFELDTKVGVVTIAKNNPACSSTSFAPAKLRMMIAYVLKDPKTVSTAIKLQNQISATAAVKPIRYGTGGSAALGKDEYVWGPGISKTADWGVWYDFKSEADLRGYFSPTDAAASNVRKELRGLAAGVVRIVIPLA